MAVYNYVLSTKFFGTMTSKSQFALAFMRATENNTPKININTFKPITPRSTW